MDAVFSYVKRAKHNCCDISFCIHSLSSSDMSYLLKLLNEKDHKTRQDKLDALLKLAKSNKLPLYITKMLNELDIAPEKATYIGELYTDDRGILYQFSYRIAGTIIGAAGRRGGIGAKDFL